MRRRIALALAAVGWVLAIAWIAEALFIGRRTISIYFGPLGLLVAVIALLLQDPGNRLYRAVVIFLAVCYVAVIVLEWLPNSK